MGACASKTNEQIDETNIEPEVFTSPVTDPVADYTNMAEEIVDGALPQNAKTETDQYEVVDHPAGGVDPVTHLDNDYQNQGFTVTENPVTHIMVREGVYMNKTTNEILYDTAVFPNGAQDVAQPMDPVPSRGLQVDDQFGHYDDSHYPTQPISYDHYPEQAAFAPEQAAFAPQQEHAAAPQENNLMVGMAMSQDPQAAAPLPEPEPQPQADEAPLPEADLPEEAAEAPVAEQKKRKKKKSKRKGWGW